MHSSFDFNALIQFLTALFNLFKDLYEKLTAEAE
jgi:hypothetical protein